MDEYNVRPATRDDCQSIRQLIQELADYEKMPEGPEISAKVLEEDGFGERPFYESYVAELKNSKRIVGYVMYFFTYSTWQGKSLYMEDIYVQPEHRSKGVGTALLKQVAQVALKYNCQRLNFSVLDWNQPSIDFYKSKGAIDLTQEEGWHFFRMYRDQIEKLASSD